MIDRGGGGVEHWKNIKNCADKKSGCKLKKNGQKYIYIYKGRQIITLLQKNKNQNININEIKKKETC